MAPTSPPERDGGALHHGGPKARAADPQTKKAAQQLFGEEPLPDVVTHENQTTSFKHGQVALGRACVYSTDTSSAQRSAQSCRVCLCGGPRGGSRDARGAHEVGPRGAQGAHKGAHGVTKGAAKGVQGVHKGPTRRAHGMVRGSKTKRNSPLSVSDRGRLPLRI